MVKKLKQVIKLDEIKKDILQCNIYKLDKNSIK